MLFSTRNSTYELDTDKRRIRRLIGSQAPTARQGADGKWQTYFLIGPIKVGDGVTIIWRMEQGVAQSTQTSPVQSITDAPINLNRDNDVDSEHNLWQEPDE